MLTTELTKRKSVNVHYRVGKNREIVNVDGKGRRCKYLTMGSTEDITVSIDRTVSEGRYVNIDQRVDKGRYCKQRPQSPQKMVLNFHKRIGKDYKYFTARRVCQSLVTAIG